MSSNGEREDSESAENVTSIRGDTPDLESGEILYQALMDTIDKIKDEVREAKDEAREAKDDAKVAREELRLGKDNVLVLQRRLVRQEFRQNDAESRMDESDARVGDVTKKLAKERSWGMKRSREQQKMMFKMTVMLYLTALFMVFGLMAYFNLFALLWGVFSCDLPEAGSDLEYSSTQRPFHVYVNPPHDEV